MYIAHFSVKRNMNQSVREHLLQVGKYCACFGRVIGLVNMAKLCGYMHDMGKYNIEFQNYLNNIKNQEVYNTNVGCKKEIKKTDHGVYGAKYIYEKYFNNGKFEKVTTEIISQVICYHHGGLPDSVNDDNKVPIIERMNKVRDEDMYKVIDIFEHENLDFNIDELFEKSVLEIKNICLKIKSNPRFFMGMIIKNLYSILVDADRLDSYLFEVGQIYKEKENTQELWEIYNRRMKKRLDVFKNKTCKTKAEDDVNKTRLKISDNCFEFADKPTGIYTLTVPTGGGKTLSSLRFALNHAKKWGKERVFYIIPYTTIIEQNAEDVRQTLDCGENLLEYHSNVLDCNKNEDYEIMSERWDSLITFTTMVQFLNTIYGSGNQDIRRMHNLENSIIIFDEIQTLPIKCIALFNESITYLNKVANSTIVLCSATQPKLDINNNSNKFKTDGEMIENVNEQFEKLKRMNVIDKTKNGEYSIEGLSEFLLELKEKTKSVLVVMNTVNSAEKLYEQFEKNNINDTKLFFLSSRLCSAHRKQIIQDLKDSLAENQSLICISTQLIEAGVDISFTATVRSLAGLDSIAQTTGRGNRHGENKICNSYIVKIKEENVSRLTEIRLGQKHTRDVLSLYNKNSEQYDNSLLSPKSISTYYERFYNDEEVKEKMPYPLKNQSIYDLLIDSRLRKSRYSNGEYPLQFSYQFETARKNFSVIDSKTKTVIVPFGDGKNLVSEFLGSNSLKEKVQLIKKAQHYSVNIYENLFRRLEEENAFIKCEIEGIILLSDSYYDDKKGVTVVKKLKTYAF